MKVGRFGIKLVHIVNASTESSLKRGAERYRVGYNRLTVGIHSIQEKIQLVFVTGGDH